MANAQWFKARALRFQAFAFDNHTPTPDLGVLIRYQTTSERAFYRGLKTLQALQKERKSAPVTRDTQFVSQIPVRHSANEVEGVEFAPQSAQMSSFRTQTTGSPERRIANAAGKALRW
jgi:hypothetical protein